MAADAYSLVWSLFCKIRNRGALNNFEINNFEAPRQIYGIWKQKTFTYKNKSYFDCTQDQSPDGQITFEPWCYSETQDGN